jgi:ATP-dependent RNA helicase MSS116
MNWRSLCHVCTSFFVPYQLVHVEKYGAPESMEGYVHRLGRTARAGKQGMGLLVLLPFEQCFLKNLRSRGIENNDKIADALESFPVEEMETLLCPARSKVGSNDKTLFPAAEAAYLSFLAYNVARVDTLGISREQVFDLVSCFARTAGLNKLPTLSPKLISKLQLENAVKITERSED